MELACTMDIYTTCLDLAGVAIPKDRFIDGVNMAPHLFGNGKSLRDAMFFYRGSRLMAVRKGPWKAHFITQAGYDGKPTKHVPPMLFHLEHDPSEKYNIADKHPEIIAEINKAVEDHRKKLKVSKSHLDNLDRSKNIMDWLTIE